MEWGGGGRRESEGGRREREGGRQEAGQKLEAWTEIKDLVTHQVGES